MASESNEEASRDDLTEEASPYRLEEYRQMGMVAQSREISSLLALLAAAVAAYALAPHLGFRLGEFMRETFQANFSPRVDLASASLMRTHLVRALTILVLTILPICGAGFLMGVFGSFAQIGAIFSLDPLAMDLNKIDPIQGFFRLFSVKQLIDSIRSIFKMAAILVVSYLIVKSEILVAPQHIYGEPTTIAALYGKSGKIIFLSLVSILGVFAGLDFWFQRFEYSKSLRMTRQEAKHEQKEREGDPQIRARIRAVQREMSRKRMMQAVKKADVVVTNPTHIAVALVYEKSSMSAPKVVAKGADFVAQKIKQVAAEAGVPLVENVPLARTLYKSVKIGQTIPKALYQVVAEVLAYVYRLRNRKL